MKKAMMKVLSLAMALTLVASLAACGGNSDDTTTTTAADDTTAEAVTPDAPAADDTTAAEETTVIVTNEDGKTEVVTAADPTQAPTQAPGKPSAPANNQPTQAPEKTTLTAQEALDLFNKATVGKAKNGNRYTKVNIVKLPGGLDKLKGTIQGMLPSPDEATPIKKPANSKLTMADCSSVTAKKSGSNWVITINVKPGASASAHAFEELPKAEIDGWLNKLKVKPIDGVKFDYKAGKITATVTPAGALVNATYTMNVTVNVKNVKALGLFSVSEAKVDVTQTDKF